MSIINGHVIIHKKRNDAHKKLLIRLKDYEFISTVATLKMHPLEYF